MYKLGFKESCCPKMGVIIEDKPAGLSVSLREACLSHYCLDLTMPCMGGTTSMMRFIELFMACLSDIATSTYYSSCRFIIRCTSMSAPNLANMLRAASHIFVASSVVPVLNKCFDHSRNVRAFSMSISASANIVSLLLKQVFAS